MLAASWNPPPHEPVNRRDLTDADPLACWNRLPSSVSQRTPMAKWFRSFLTQFGPHPNAHGRPIR